MSNRGPVTYLWGRLFSYHYGVAHQQSSIRFTWPVILQTVCTSERCTPFKSSAYYLTPSTPSRAPKPSATCQPITTFKTIQRCSLFMVCYLLHSPKKNFLTCHSLQQKPYCTGNLISVCPYPYNCPCSSLGRLSEKKKKKCWTWNEQLFPQNRPTMIIFVCNLHIPFYISITLRSPQRSTFLYIKCSNNRIKKIASVLFFWGGGHLKLCSACI